MGVPSGSETAHEKAVVNGDAPDVRVAVNEPMTGGGVLGRVVVVVGRAVVVVGFGVGGGGAGGGGMHDASTSAPRIATHGTHRTRPTTNRADDPALVMPRPFEPSPRTPPSRVASPVPSVSGTFPQSRSVLRAAPDLGQLAEQNGKRAGERVRPS